MWKLEPDPPISFWAQIPCLNVTDPYESYVNDYLRWQRVGYDHQRVEYRLYDDGVHRYYFVPIEDNSTVLATIGSSISELNRLYFQFDIDNLENVFLCKFDSSCKISFDSDFNYQGSRSKKLTFYIPLNEDFSGGESILSVGKSSKLMTPTPGMLTATPSFICAEHKGPASNQIKHMIIGSVTGKRFK